MTKLRSECSADEIVLYTDHYFATIDSVNDSAFKFGILATFADNPADRSLYRAKTLEAQRDAEVLRGQRRAFNVDSGPINPPTADEVTAAIFRSEKLAEVRADGANANLILKLFDDSVSAFSKIVGV
ncbi:hypothetical protein NHH88_05900 [Oxalobacteraceae bacterium OTU3CAMAD1]|nr:hypothetical protein NHH88_05900 [Oxalobacteraceae bacterium OTU3CAMAD1]